MAGHNIWKDTESGKSGYFWKGMSLVRPGEVNKICKNRYDKGLSSPLCFIWSLVSPKIPSSLDLAAFVAKYWYISYL